jgi:hypothetical protein
MREIYLEASFDAPWPGVLLHVQDWIRQHLVLAGVIQQLEISVYLDLGLLQQAKLAGQALQPAYNQFKAALEQAYGPVVQSSPRDNAGHHLATLTYWK